MAAKKTVYEISGRLVEAEVSGNSIILPQAAPSGAPVFPDIKIATSPSQPRSAGGNATQQHARYDSSGQILPTLGRILQSLVPGVSQQRVERRSGTALAWHTHQKRLAVADEANRIQVFDLSPTPSHQAQSISPPQPVMTLQHKEQSQVTSLDFRPHSRGELAVGFRGGVAHWKLWQQPTVASGGFQPRLLFPEAPADIVDVVWSPCGRLLAGAHGDRRGFTIWDAALGTATTVSSGLGTTGLLRWSQDGSYLLTSGPGGVFTLWESSKWQSATFHAPAGNEVVSAAWSNDSRVALLAFSGTAYLCGLHIIGQPPSLRAQLLPLELPELTDHRSSTGGTPTMSAIAWDPTSERLAVAFGAGREPSGDVALYATASSPVVRAQFLGTIRPGGSGNVEALSFHRCFEGGALLAVRSESGCVSTIPLLYE